MPALYPVKPPGPPVWSRDRRIGHYGGALDKEDSKTEGDAPYAAFFYDELGAMRGSAYRDATDGHVHVQKLAIARMFAGLWRTSERRTANSLPGTSHERLAYWVEVLGITVRVGELDHEVRERCAAKYRLGDGPTIAGTDEAVEKLLGNAWVRNWRQEGSDLANPPTQTYWPGINPGPASHDLGGGAWLSERSHLVVETQIPDGMTDGEFLELMNVHLWRLLDDTVPSWATMNWSLNVSTGFLLDISQMDWDGFNP